MILKFNVQDSSQVPGNGLELGGQDQHEPEDQAEEDGGHPGVGRVIMNIFQQGVSSVQLEFES